MIAPIVAGEADYVNGSRLLGYFEKESTIRHFGVHFFSRLVTILTGTRDHRHLQRLPGRARRPAAKARAGAGPVLDERGPDRGAPPPRANRRGADHDPRARAAGSRRSRSPSSTAGTSPRRSSRPGCASRRPGSPRRVPRPARCPRAARGSPGGFGRRSSRRARTAGTACAPCRARPLARPILRFRDRRRHLVRVQRDAPGHRVAQEDGSADTEIPRRGPSRPPHPGSRYGAPAQTTYRAPGRTAADPTP